MRLEIFQFGHKMLYLQYEKAINSHSINGATFPERFYNAVQLPLEMNIFATFSLQQALHEEESSFTSRNDWVVRR